VRQVVLEEGGLANWNRVSCYDQNAVNVVGAPYLCHSEGRVWFEVEVLMSYGLRVGFVGTNFRERGIGNDERSWAIDYYSSFRSLHRHVTITQR
jgi:hypothetical protein